MKFLYRTAPEAWMSFSHRGRNGLTTPRDHRRWLVKQGDGLTEQSRLNLLNEARQDQLNEARQYQLNEARQDQRSEARQDQLNEARQDMLFPRKALARKEQEKQRQREAADRQRDLEGKQNAACRVNDALFKDMNKVKTAEDADVRRGKHELSLFVAFHDSLFGRPSKMTQGDKKQEKASLKKVFEKYPPGVQKILIDHFNATYCKRPSA